jgi:RNA recognition motif-containing protein
MDSADEAQKAIDALDGSDFSGRQIKVNVARERSR